MKKLSLKTFLILGIVLLLASTSIAAPGNSLNKGEVDWSQGVIKVIGYGAPPKGKTEPVTKLLAQRAAKADAYRNAAEVIKGVRVNSTTKVKDYVVTSDKISTQVSGLIKNGRFEDVKYNSDGTCKVKLVLPLAGQKGLSSFFEEVAVEESSSHPVATEERYSEKETKTESETKETEKVIKKEEYTGVVIDTRGLNVIPALYPQIFDSDGYLLYGPTLVKADNASNLTMVAYSRSLEKALKMERIGDNPLQIKATSTVKNDNQKTTDIILNKENAKAFLKSDRQNNIVDKKSIVFVID